MGFSRNYSDFFILLINNQKTALHSFQKHKIFNVTFLSSNFFFKRGTQKHYLQYLMQCFGHIDFVRHKKLEKTFASYGGEQMHITRLLAIY